MMGGHGASVQRRSLGSEISELSRWTSASLEAICGDYGPRFRAESLGEVLLSHACIRAY